MQSQGRRGLQLCNTLPTKHHLHTHPHQRSAEVPEGVVVPPCGGEENAALLRQREGLHDGTATGEGTLRSERENSAKEEESVARVIGVARDEELEVLDAKRLKQGCELRVLLGRRQAV